MRVLKYIVIAIVLSMTFTSCLLKSEESYYKKVSSTSNSKNQNTVLYSYADPNGSTIFFPLKDTIWLSNEVSFQLNGGATVSQLAFSINNQDPISMGAILQVTGGAYQIKKGTLANGTYNLQIRQMVPSGTGSLADLAGEEFTEFTSNYVLVVESNNSYVPQITSIVLQNGTIKLSWNQYNRDDFQYYKIVKIGNWDNRELLVSNKNQTTLSDSTYVAGNITYQLVANNGNDITSTTYPFNYTYTPRVSLTKISNNDFRLSWTPPATYNNVKNYSITMGSSSGNPNGSQLYFDVAGPLTFGIPYYSYGIDTYAKVSSDIAGTGDQVSYTGNIYLGQRIPYFNSVLHDTQKAVYYLLGINEITPVLYQLDDQTYNVIDSVVSLLGSSTNGKVLASANGQYHYIINDNEIQRFDPNTLSAIETISLSILDPSLSSFVFHGDNTALTDNNLLLFQGSDTYSYVADLSSVSIVFKFSGTGHLSSNGSLLINGADLYSFSSGTYNKITTLPYSNIVYEQFLNNTSQVVLLTPSSVVVYDCLNNVEISSWPITSNILTWASHLDQSSKKIYLAGEYALDQVFDLASGGLKNLNSQGVIFFEGDALFYSSDYIPEGGFVLKNY